VRQNTKVTNAILSNARQSLYFGQKEIIVSIPVNSVKKLLQSYFSFVVAVVFTLYAFNLRQVLQALVV